MDLVNFLKMHALGNDFVIILMEDEVQISKKIIENLSNREKGVGCDLVVFLQEKKDNFSDLKASFYNSDGSEAEVCGNALRCIGKYFFRKSKKKNIVVETISGLIDIEEESKDKIIVDLGTPKFGWKEIPLGHNVDNYNMEIKLDYLKGGFALNIGNPHLGFFVDELVEKRFVSNCKNLINDSLFPQGINVSAVKIISRNQISSMTFERGVGMTSACGTGACASVIASNKKNFCEKKVNVHMRGGNLDVEISNDNHIFMIGNAVEVFEGRIDLKRFG